MRLLKLIAICSFVLTTLHLPAQTARHIYVSPAGNDKNPGTEAAPLRSIQSAIRLSFAIESDSTEIILRDGIYQLEST
ncbi:MAG: DUF1565 domain-containing protein, partial [Paramuribaculum sp.]|nr:DUF1565 domain-containing protein [Paramuribaculum sp.]